MNDLLRRRRWTAFRSRAEASVTNACPTGRCKRTQPSPTPAFTPLNGNLVGEEPGMEGDNEVGIAKATLVPERHGERDTAKLR